MARESASWREVSAEEKGRARLNEDHYNMALREGWSPSPPSNIKWDAMYKGIRPHALCSDRSRKYCMKIGGLCYKAVGYPRDTAKDKHAKEVFRKCIHYCLQQETVLVNRPKELKFRNQT